MRFRSWLAALLLLPVLLVAAFNVPALVAPVPVDLGLLQVRLPLWPAVVGVPVVLVAVFLGAALLDRARQLRQLAALERQLAEARAAVDAGREAAVDGVAKELGARLAALEAVVEGVASGLEARVGARLEALEGRRAARDAELGERVKALEARVVTVRDELAADVAEAEDALLRALRADDRTLDLVATRALPPERG